MKKRRNVLKMGVIGGASLAGLATPVSARSKRQSAPEVKVTDVTPVKGGGNLDFSVVSMVVADGDTETKLTYLAAVGEDYASAKEISSGTGERLETGGVHAVSSEVTAMGEGVVERWKNTSSVTGDCAVYGGYDHEFGGVAIEFEQRVNDIGITTAAAVVAAILASAGAALIVIVGVIVIGGLLALVSTSDSITIGVNEIDTIFGSVPNQQPVIAAGYDVTNEEAFEGYGTAPPGHPFR